VSFLYTFSADLITFFILFWPSYFCKKDKKIVINLLYRSHIWHKQSILKIPFKRVLSLIRWPWTLTYMYLKKHFNINTVLGCITDFGFYLCTIRHTVFILDMCLPCVKIFSTTHHFNLWPWPWPLTCCCISLIAFHLWVYGHSSHIWHIYSFWKGHSLWKPSFSIKWPWPTPLTYF